MKVWILEQDQERSKALRKCVEEYLENIGVKSRIDTFRAPDEVDHALKHQKNSRRCCLLIRILLTGSSPD